MKENSDSLKYEKNNFAKNENKNNFNFKALKRIIDDIQMGLCIVEKQYSVDPTNLQNKKALKMQYYNNMFLDHLQLNVDEEELEANDILKVLKEFVFLNEDENSSPFSNHSKGSSRDNVNNNFNSVINNS